MLDFELMPYDFTRENLVQFETDFFAHKYPSLRYGQAFHNVFGNDAIEGWDIYDLDDVGVCRSIVWFAIDNLLEK